MQPSFLQKYLNSFHRIQGWFVFDAAILFMAYNQLIRAAGIAGDTLEIGVYRGLSALAIASLRAPGRRMYAIDLFDELAGGEAYGSGSGYRRMFEDNMRSFYTPLDFLVSITGASGKLKTSDFDKSFSFCHVDGGHSPEETCADLQFASEILLPGGLLALDDYFNPQHPGVCEGALEFRRKNDGVLRPLALGYNKVLFQKAPHALDLNARFRGLFPAVESSPAGDMWGAPIFLFDKPLRIYFDLYASTPERLAPIGCAGVRATFTPGRARLSAGPGQTTTLPVTVRNTSTEAFPAGDGVFGLSYHLLTANGQTIQHDHPRTYLRAPLEPGQQTQLDLAIAAPATPGTYRLELDLVWEGVMWLSDIGNPNGRVELDII
jgi:hypothetical protein